MAALACGGEEGSVSSGGSSVTSLTLDFSTIGFTPNADDDTLLVFVCYALNTSGVTFTADSNSTALDWHELAYQDGGQHPCAIFCMKAADITSGDVVLRSSSAKRLRMILYEFTNADVDSASWPSWPSGGANDGDLGDLDFTKTGMDGGGGIWIYNQNSPSSVVPDSDWTATSTQTYGCRGYRTPVTGQPQAEDNVITTTSGSKTGCMAAIGAEPEGICMRPGASGTAVGSAVTPSVTLERSPASGELIVAVLMVERNEATALHPSGFTGVQWFEAFSSENYYRGISYKWADGTEGTTINFGAQSGADDYLAAIYTFQGIDSVTPLDSGFSATVSGGNSHDPRSLNGAADTDNDNSLIFAYYTSDYNGLSSIAENGARDAFDSGPHEIVDITQANWDLYIGWGIAGVAGSYGMTFDFTANKYGAGGIVAFNADSGGPAAPGLNQIESPYMRGAMRGMRRRMV